MKTVTIKGFVHKDRYGDSYKFWAMDMSEYGDLLVGPVEFEYVVPDDFNPIAAEVACLEKKLDSIKDEHASQVRQINERIASLLCIENNPSVPA